MSGRAGAFTALAVGFATLLIVLGVALSQSRPRLAGTNNVRDPIFAAMVPGGASVCQDAETVPADADRVRLQIGTYNAPMPPLGLTIQGPATRITGRTPGGGRQGYVFIAIPRRKRPAEGVRICLHNAGSRPIAVGGEAIPPQADIGGQKAAGRLRFAWYRPGSENWFQLAPVVLHRFSLGNAPWFGGWLLVVVAFLLVTAGALSVLTVFREMED